MPTMEERLEALECALAALKLEHIYAIKQLDERISTLHQQVAEQKRWFSEAELKNKFAADHFATTTGSFVLTQQNDIKAMKERLIDMDRRIGGVDRLMEGEFEQLDKCIDRIDQQLMRMDQRFDGIDQQVAVVKQDVSSLHSRFDDLEKLIINRLSSLQV